MLAAAMAEYISQTGSEMNGFERRINSLGHRLANAVPGLVRPEGRPVLIVGNGRSGTSWIGETLGYGAGKLYYREPCHPNRNGLSDAEADAVWSRYVPKDGDDRFFTSTIERALQGKRWQGAGLDAESLSARLAGKPRIIVKEVSAFLSLEWICTRWDPDILIIIRHPGAYVASVNNLDQQQEEFARFEHLKNNPLLRERYLQPFMAHLETLTHPAAVMAASWAIRNFIIIEAMPRYPDWHLVRYEEVALDPLAQFKMLYERYDLPWSEEVERFIEDKTTSQDDGKFTTARLSASRVDAWRKKLSAEDMQQIRAAIAPFDLPYYASLDDWPAL